MSLLEETNKILREIREEEEVNYGRSSGGVVESTQVKAVIQAVEKRLMVIEKLLGLDDNNQGPEL